MNFVYFIYSLTPSLRRGLFASGSVKFSFNENAAVLFTSNSFRS